jgi:hypothetical protein
MRSQNPRATARDRYARNAVSFAPQPDGSVVATCSDPPLLAAGRTREEAEAIVGELMALVTRDGAVVTVDSRDQPAATQG